MRICSEEEYFNKRLEELKTNFLIPRNYHTKVIEGQFKRVKNLPGTTYSERRNNALKKKEVKINEKKDKVIAAVDFNPSLPKMSEVFSKHFKSMIFRKPELKETFKDPPMPAYRQAPNIRKIVCRSKLPILMIDEHRNFPLTKYASKKGVK